METKTNATGGNVNLTTIPPDPEVNCNYYHRTLIKKVNLVVFAAFIAAILSSAALVGSFYIHYSSSQNGKKLEANRAYYLQTFSRHLDDLDILVRSRFEYNDNLLKQNIVDIKERIQEHEDKSRAAFEYFRLRDKEEEALLLAQISIISDLIRDDISARAERRDIVVEKMAEKLNKELENIVEFYYLRLEQLHTGHIPNLPPQRGIGGGRIN